MQIFSPKKLFSLAYNSCVVSCTSRFGILKYLCLSFYDALCLNMLHLLTTTQTNGVSANHGARLAHAYRRWRWYVDVIEFTERKSPFEYNWRTMATKPAEYICRATIIKIVHYQKTIYVCRIPTLVIKRYVFKSRSPLKYKHTFYNDEYNKINLHCDAFLFHTIFRNGTKAFQI